jgi:hypothetical protein
MEETVGRVSTCGRELLRGWWRPIGLMVSFMNFTASVRNMLDTTSYRWYICVIVCISLLVYFDLNWRLLFHCNRLIPDCNRVLPTVTFGHISNGVLMWGTQTTPRVLQFHNVVVFRVHAFYLKHVREVKPSLRRSFLKLQCLTALRSDVLY